MASKQVVLLVASLVSAATNVVAADETDDAPLAKRRAHEAFAGPSTDVANPGRIVASKPPPALLESPSAKKLGPSAVWVPGYWSWDPTAVRYAWVSGVWRLAPPGMRWLPGYWKQAKEGWRWCGGFWFSANEPRLQYLPDPPPAKEEPPSKRSADRFVVPGYWSYADGKYVWKPGFQAQAKAGWLWTPAHYVWTPRGNIFVPGYWDYSIGRRGEGLTPPRTTSLQPTNSAQRAAAATSKLVRLRQQFETSGENANATGPATLDLPADLPTNQHIVGEAGPTTEESLPGVVGRQVPGVRRRALPGVSGRRVPGVEADLPDVAAPGVDPREIRPKP